MEMKEDFVTYKQARELKELGFDYSTFAYYWKSETDLYYGNFIDRNNTNENYIAAPTLAQAAKWLREKCNIFISINIYFPNYKDDDYSFTKYGFIFIDRRYNYVIRIESEEYNQLFDTYEEALSGAINDALKLLKE